MLQKNLVILSFFIFFSSFAFADDTHAQSLITKAECMVCHNKIPFATSGKTTSFSQLYSAVQRCAYGNNADWFDDDMMDVTKYLNKKYYFFKEPVEED